MKLKERGLSSLGDGGYLRLSGEYLFIAHAAFSEKHFPLFCQNSTSSVEMLLRHSLLNYDKSGVTDEKDFRQYNHSIRGMSKDVEGYLEPCDIKSLEKCLSPLLPYKKTKGKKLDPGFNGYKYPEILNEIKPSQVKWPHQRITKTQAIFIYKNVIPTVVKLLGGYSGIDPKLFSPIQQTLPTL